LEAAAAAGIRPVICRQERVGVGIADGFSRVANGKRIGVFAMQAGPGVENGFSGVATAFSDSVPILLLPTGYQRNAAQVMRFFKSVDSYAPVTKWAEPLNVAAEELKESDLNYQPVKAAHPAVHARDVVEAAKVLAEAKRPVIYAGQGILYAEACKELVEFAGLLQAPVATTLEGKSAFPEDHPLSLGTGCSLTRHGIVAANIPPGKVIVHATDDERDINKHYRADFPVLGDARLVLGHLTDTIKKLPGKERHGDGNVADQIKEVREEWLNEWMPKLTSKEVPINPYRVIWDFVNTVKPDEAIVTHDAGSPRNQLAPLYRATVPRSYLGWGKSHGLGTGLGLFMGAKLAVPDKFCVNFMGDAAFGMTGLDFETAVRSGIPILTVVLNNLSMAVETRNMSVSHERYRTRDVGGNYADMGRAMGGYAERIEKPGYRPRHPKGQEGDGRWKGGPFGIHHQPGNGLFPPTGPLVDK
jgi:acetolactate synthase-1/2/3 large subunit